MKRVKGSPQPLGVVVESGQINFAVFAPAGKQCELLLYRAGETEPAKVYEMPEERESGEVRFLAVEDLDPLKYEYNFRIGGKICIDPYVKELAGSEEFGKVRDLEKHEVRGRFMVSDYDWEDDRRPLLPWHEVVAYSMHVRGFTKHSSSRVRHKGTFAGVAEKIPYLLELGVNQIQCMPVYEFEETVGGKCNYWGYGEGFFFAPKASYSVSGHAGKELKDMVKACHKAGIEVVLEMPFVQNILPQTAVECLKYYMLEYHVDGFVVNPYNVPWEGLKQDPLLRGVKIIRKDDFFQTVMRRFLKGDEGMVDEVIRALRHNTKEDGKCNYMTGHTGFTLCDLVSYDAKHNLGNGEQNHDGPDYNYSWNCGAEGPSRKKAVIELRRRQMRNAFALLLMAQGTPCILAGDEFCNTQKGNNNVYCQDNEIAWLDWGGLKREARLFEYVKKLIMLRKTHSVLHCEETLLGRDRTSSGIPDVSYHGENAWQTPAQVFSRQLGVLYCGAGLEDVCYIAYNMHWVPHSFALPALPKKKNWYRAFDTYEKDGSMEEQEELYEDGKPKSIELKARSIVLLLGK